MPRYLLYWTLGILICSIFLFPAIPTIYLQIQVAHHKKEMQKPGFLNMPIEVFTFSTIQFKSQLVEENEMLIHHKRYDIIEKKRLSKDSVCVKVVMDNYEEQLLLQILAISDTERNDRPFLLHVGQPDWTCVPINLNLKQDDQFDLSFHHFILGLKVVLPHIAWFPPPDLMSNI